MTRRFSLLFVIVLWAFWAGALQLEDFAYGMLVEIAEDAPLQRVLVSADVYRGLEHEDMRDLRVFNARGEEVPFAIVPAAFLSEPEPRRVEIPAYALLLETEEADVEELAENLEAEPEVGIQEMLGLQMAPAGPVSYVFDTSQVGGEIHGLRLSWDEGAESFLSVIALESSDDLLNWEPWGNPVAIVGLRTGTWELRRNEISLPARRVGFIRVVQAEGGLPLPELSHVEAELVTAAPEGERRWWRPRLSSAQDGVYDLEAAMTVDGMRLVFPPGHAVVGARLLSSRNENRGWQPRFEGLFYSFAGEDAEMSFSSARFEPTADRYWRLELAGGDLAEEIVLELGQIPEQLVFLARGEAPFTLAYGSAAAEAGGQLPMLLDLEPLREGRVEIAAASLSPAFELGGEAALVSPTRSRLRYGLITAALLGALMLGLIVLRRRIEARREKAAG
jgi:hypothetical protein